MKKIIVLFALCTTMRGIQAQVSYMHSFGGSYYFNLTNIYESWQGLSYNGRLIYKQMKEITLDAGARPGVGFYYDPYYGGFLAFDIPVTADINAGFGSSKGDNSDIGGFLGIGGDYNYLNGYPYPTTGVIFTGGIRFMLFDRPIELNAAYVGDLSQYKQNLLDIGISYLINY